MKNILIVAVAVALLAGGGFWYSRQKSASGVASQQTNGRPTQATALNTNISFSVTVAGEIGPAEQVSVRPEVNGRIAELPVDIGDRVKAGSLLFALDDKDLRIEVDTRKKEIESAQLQLEKAKLHMEQAERDFQRDKKLFDSKLVSEQVYENTRQTWDSTKKDYQLAMNSIERSRANQALAEEKLSKTQVKAPFDCTVLTRPISVGQAVSGSGGFNSGTEVMTIANLSDLIIAAHVNQSDVTRLRAGMEVKVQIEAVAGLVVTGIVERISPQATIVNNIKGFSTRIRLKSPDARVQPGMTANITIPVATASNVVAVPLAAVFTEFNAELQRNERYVFILKESGKFERRPVRIGVSDYFHAEVQSGVNPGETVAIEKPANDKLLEPVPAQAGQKPATQAAAVKKNS